MINFHLFSVPPLDRRRVKMEDMVQYYSGLYYLRDLLQLCLDDHGPLESWFP